MKNCLFAIWMSALSLSCSMTASPPETGSIDGATANSSDSESPDSAEASQAVVESPTTLEACLACNGDWGMHGLADAIAQTESCDCRTNDAGKRCTDGTDCQGACVANADNPEYDAIDVGPPERGFLVGRCSELVTVFGCHALVDSGARDDGPVSIGEPPPVLCVD